MKEHSDTSGSLPAVWAQLKMRPLTHARLKLYAATLQEAVRRDPTKFPGWMQGGSVSLSDAIDHLLNRVQGHGWRSKRSKKKRRAKLAEEGMKE